MINNIIIQAGGYGQRAKRYTKNKPKCLLSIDGKPLLFHICDKFTESKIIVILTENSTNCEVFEKFMQLHPNYSSKISILLSKNSGDASSLKDSLDICDGGTLICWSDIIFSLPLFCDTENIVFLTNKIPCRWKIDNGLIQQDKGNGILGCFYVANPKIEKQYFLNNGTIIETLLNKEFKFNTVMVNDCKEFGLEEEITKNYNLSLPIRFYNKVLISDVVEKHSLDKEIIKREINWYNEISATKFTNVPCKLKDTPLTIEKINGDNLYNYLSADNEIDINSIFSMLDDLHNDVGYITNNNLRKEYIEHTIPRINKISNIHSLFNNDFLVINGKKCFNLIKNQNYLENKIIDMLCGQQKMVVSHGDPILSNIIIDKNKKLYLIDPRGYFGDMIGLFGSKLYDDAKLYFSSVMNFDTFNKKLFSLEITNNGFNMQIDFRKHCFLFKEEFRKRFDKEYLIKIRFLASLIWLRFGSCVLDDYDSIIASLVFGISNI